jgi:hypothetical protein
VALDLLHVRWVIAALTLGPADPTLQLRTREGPWGLYERSSTSGRATVVGSWLVARSPDEALSTVTAPGFDPAAVVVLERDPGLAPGASGCPPAGGAGCPPSAGPAIYRDEGAGSGTVLVDTTAPGIVLIRNPIGPGWEATLDGRPVPLLTADFLDQGVAVPAGRHVIELTYRDRAIGSAFAGSVLALVILFGLAGFAAARTRRREAQDLTVSFGRTDGPGPAGGP